MKVLIYNFDAVNPLAHEWSHILVEQNMRVTLIDHRESIRCSESRIRLVPLGSFKARKRDDYDAIFVPWLPSRRYFFKFLIDWIKCGVPQVYWIDHNPILGRDRHGILLQFLRNQRSTRLQRVVHSAITESSAEPKLKTLLHPVFLHAFEDIPKKDIDKPSEVITFAFIGRLDDQKGFFELPKFAELISNEVSLETKWIVAGNNSELDKVQRTVDEISRIPKVSVEAYIYGKKCPSEYIYKALLSANFLVAPYQQITASGTISLAIACGTEVISLNSSAPLGLEAFDELYIHCVKTQDITRFLRMRIKANQLDDKTKCSITEARLREHNLLCGKKFIELHESTRKVKRYSNE